MSPQMKTELKNLKEELLQKLAAVNLLLGDEGDTSNTKPSPNQPAKPVGTPKGDMTWPDYTLLLLKQIGGEGKSKDVSGAAKKANPELDTTMVENQIKHHLSKLNVAGIIDAKPVSSSRKDGNIYKVKEQKNQPEAGL